MHRHIWNYRFKNPIVYPSIAVHDLKDAIRRHGNPGCCASLQVEQSGRKAWHISELDCFDARLAGWGKVHVVRSTPVTIIGFQNNRVRRIP